MSNNIYRPKHIKIAILFAIFLFLFFIFLTTMFRIMVVPRDTTNLRATKTIMALRGSIYSSDLYTLASSDKLYKASVHSGRIYEDKKELFAKLFSIYSGISKDEIRKKLDTNRYVFLAKNLDSKQATSIKVLSKKLLYKFDVFKGVKTRNKIIYQGIEIKESGEKRVYPYKKSFTPLLGYIQNREKNDFILSKGIKGIENFYEDYLGFRVDGKMRGRRDINSFIIFNRDSVLSRQNNGFDIVLNIPLRLQLDIENMLLKYKYEFQAQEIIASIIDTKTGKVLVLATSNRFDSSNIRQKDYPLLNPRYVEHLFEPGSVIKPIVIAKLFEDKLIDLNTIVSGHNGKFRLNNKVITDEHIQDYFSASQAISQSSNIAMAQFGLKLKSEEFSKYMHLVGLGELSNIDLSYEKKGIVPTATRLDNDINKATLAYGYGLSVNFMQLLKAYSMFDNDGNIVTPKIVDYIIDSKKEPIFIKKEIKKVISKDTAKKVRKMLINTVKSGTARVIQTQGVEIGAKTGTAQVFKDGKYAKEYISSVFGFVNDSNKSYTIGVTTFFPKKNYFASSTSAKVFKSIVDKLIEDKYLKPIISK
jgi:cell division protein FtsI (penicillin-binding protein 3)